MATTTIPTRSPLLSAPAFACSHRQGGRGTPGPHLRSGARGQSVAKRSAEPARALRARLAGGRRRGPRVCRAEADAELLDAIPAPEAAVPAEAAAPLGEAVDSAASAVGEAVAQGSASLDASAERLDGTSQVIVSVLSTAAFALLFVLTLGVGYLSYKGWQDEKNSRMEREGQGITFAGGDKGGAQAEKGKPVLSKVGKGFAKSGGAGAGVVSGSRLGAKRKAKGSSGSSSGSSSPSADMKGAAKRAAESGLPAGWQAFTDPKTEKPYYYNEETKVTQWDKPT